MTPCPELAQPLRHPSAEGRGVPSPLTAFLQLFSLLPGRGGGEGQRGEMGMAVWEKTRQWEIHQRRGCPGWGRHRDESPNLRPLVPFSAHSPGRVPAPPAWASAVASCWSPCFCPDAPVLHPPCGTRGPCEKGGPLMFPIPPRVPTRVAPGHYTVPPPPAPSVTSLADASTPDTRAPLRTLPQVLSGLELSPRLTVSLLKGLLRGSLLWADWWPTEGMSLPKPWSLRMWPCVKKGLCRRQ